MPVAIGALACADSIIPVTSMAMAPCVGTRCLSSKLALDNEPSLGKSAVYSMTEYVPRKLLDCDLDIIGSCYGHLSSQSV